jgi:hypothetical protein
MKPIAALAAAALVFAAGQVQAQPPLAFVACPILRDTATVPCWLTEYKGELYFLLPQDGAAGASAPQLGHQALFEGTATAETRCGGKVLTNLHISVLPERDRSCDALWPASQAFQVDPPKAAAAPAPAAPPPDRKGSQRFDILYDFDAGTAGRNTAAIEEAAAYAKANPKAEVHVTGFRAAVKLTGGGVLNEDDGIALRRADELVDALAAQGLERGSILEVDGAGPDLGDYTARHAYIDIIMKAGDEPNSEH